MNLSTYEQKILSALDTQGGYTTGDVAGKVHPQFGSNKRQHSGAVRSWLINLEKRGLVRKLDEQKPVCWVKTSTGENALVACMGKLA